MNSSQQLDAIRTQAIGDIGFLVSFSRIENFHILPNLLDFHMKHVVTTAVTDNQKSLARCTLDSCSVTLNQIKCSWFKLAERTLFSRPKISPMWTETSPECFCSFQVRGQDVPESCWRDNITQTSTTTAHLSYFGQVLMLFSKLIQNLHWL